MLERDIEAYLVAQVEARGGVAEKVVSLSGRGFFDRLVVLPPRGVVAFVECKKPKGSHTAPHQKTRRQKYLDLGAVAVIVKSTADVDKLMAELSWRQL